MTHASVVLLGRVSAEHRVLDALAGEFGWSFVAADNIRSLAALNQRHNVVAVLFSPKSLELPWGHALRATLQAAPGALPILCHGFADAIDWPQAANAGAFHSVLVPFKLEEVRQSLGFVWGAKRRSQTVLRKHAHA